MTANRNYSSVARLATSTGAISNSSTTIPVDQTTGFPTPPFTMVIDAGRTAEEIITCTAIVGLNLTILRGVDGSSAQPHDAAATVRHMATARDYREPAEHIGLTAGVHGVGGSVVGTSDSQILDNKTFEALVTDHVPVSVLAASGQTADLFQLKSNAGAVIASFGVTGALTVPSITTSFGATTFAGAVSASSFTTAGPITGAALTVAAITASGRIATPGVDGATQSIFTSPDISTIPLVVKTFLLSTQAAISVRDSTGVSRAGIWADTHGYQLYHGGKTTNLVPWIQVGGSVACTIQNGTTSISGTIDYSAFGFTVTPLVYLTVRQDNQSTIQRRVTANVENIPGLTTCGFRAFQTAGDNVTSDSPLHVYWQAIQFTPTTAIS